MCGFTGFGLLPKGSVEGFELEHRAMLERMNGTLVHRGPDDEGYCLRAPFGLGFRRLSIIDVAGGHQPIEAPGGDLAVVGNGEVYNFQSLRSELQGRGAGFQSGSDIETILHLYREQVPRGGGEPGDLLAIPRALVGMFAFAVADWRDPDCPRILLGRDRLGIKPLYWCETSDGLFFGSEVKSILAAGVADREMRREGLLDYLVQGYVGGHNSAWVGIQRLPAGSVLSWNPRDGVRIQRYWDLPKDELREAPTEAEVREWLWRVVEDRLVAEVPLGAFLSGGLDSNAVAHAMRDATGEAPVLCTVGFQEKSHDELGLAKETAAALGAVHHTEILEPDPRVAIDELPWFYDEPLADPSTVPTWLVSKVARRHVTVALSGDGGDEIFGGYRRYVHDVAENRIRQAVGGPGRGVMGALGRVYPKLDWAPRVFRAKTFLTNTADDPARAYWRSVSHMECDAAAALLAPDLREALEDHDPFDASRPTVPARYGSLYRAQYADFHTWLPDRILAKVDRAASWRLPGGAGPAPRPPLRRGFAHSPVSSKVRAGRGKHVLRESLRGTVAGGVLDGAKRGFDTPLAGWIRGPLAEATRDAVEGLPEDWFDRGRLRATLNAHMSGGVNHDRLLWSLLVLEAWRRRHGVARIGA